MYTRECGEVGLGRGMWYQPFLDTEPAFTLLDHAIKKLEPERGREGCLPLLRAQSIVALGVHQLVHAVI